MCVWEGEEGRSSGGGWVVLSGKANDWSDRVLVVLVLFSN